MEITEAATPWWALAALDLPSRSDPSRIRELAQRGALNRIRKTVAFHDLWFSVVAQAEQFAAAAGSPEQLVRDDPLRARKAALSSPRAFVQYCQILDDTLKVPTLKDFHVRTLRAMREQPQSLVLLPFAHGKSWLSSILCPLMDWAEEPEFTEARIYYNDRFVKLWTRKLMAVVENTKALHDLFPWVDKPSAGDPCEGFWSTEGFSIKGKRAIEPSFEGLTVAQGITGRRYWRTGCDDWVISENARSELIQERFWEYFFTGPMTMQKPVPFRSHYQTRASNVFVVGTLFDTLDFNARLMKRWREASKFVYRVDVYTDRSKQEVIWPEERPLEFIEELRLNMGERAFNMRCRNLVRERDAIAFPEELVDRAIRTDWQYGVAPGMSRLLIGFDPATGKRSKRHSYPAAAVIAWEDDTLHVVKWARWAVPMPRQCEYMAEWARQYQCPVAVEEANTQAGYAHWLRQIAPDVQCISHTTHHNKRDWRQGVESFLPLFETDNIRIHAQGCPPDLLKALRDELVTWPSPGMTTDLVMAMWIAKYQFELRFRTQQQHHQITEPIPGRRRGLGVRVNLQALREMSSR